MPRKKCCDRCKTLAHGCVQRLNKTWICPSCADKLIDPQLTAMQQPTPGKMPPRYE